MHFRLLFLASLACFTSSSPILSPLDTGILDPFLRNYMASAFVRAGALRNIYPTCNSLQNVSMNAGTLPPPSPGLQLWHVAVGRGTQNYSCSAAQDATAAPVALGAVAKLYNATCATGYLGEDVVNKFTNWIAQQDKNQNLAQYLIQSGNHYFSDLTTPTFNLNLGSPFPDYGIAFTHKISNITAPTDAATSQDGSAAVPWLKLAVWTPPPVPYQIDVADSAPGITEVYRLNTAGGAAPKTCDGLVGTNFTREYAAEYYFWHAPGQSG